MFDSNNMKDKQFSDYCLKAFPALLCQANKENSEPSCSSIGFIAFNDGSVEIVPFHYNDDSTKQYFIDACRLSYRNGDAVGYCFIAKNWTNQHRHTNHLFVEYKAFGNPKVIVKHESKAKLLDSSEKNEWLFDDAVAFHLAPSGTSIRPFLASAIHVNISELMDYSSK